MKKKQITFMALLVLAATVATMGKAHVAEDQWPEEQYYNDICQPRPWRISTGV